MIYMRIYGTEDQALQGPWHIKASVPGKYYNPSGLKAVWTIEGSGDLQSLLNRLASKVQASKPFPKW